MIFRPATVHGVFLIQPDVHEDERGALVRTFCAEEFARHGLPTQFAQGNVSYNRLAGTLRGMHWQSAPHREAKLVRCAAGAAYDVVLDIREDSPTFGHWEAFVLSADNRHSVFIPEGCAHGFQTMRDGTELTYLMSAPYAPEAARGLRWNDPRFSICWPVAPRRILSERDAAWPDYAPAKAPARVVPCSQAFALSDLTTV